MTSKPSRFHLPSHHACEMLTAAVVEAKLAPDSRVHGIEYASGSTIWRPSDVPDRVFRLKSGRVHIVHINADGQEYLYRAVAPGELFGEICLCKHRREAHSTEARSLGRSDVWVTSYEDFRRSIRTNVSLVDSVIQTFCARVAEAEQRIEILARGVARARLARLLVHLAEMKVSPSAVRAQESSLTVTHADLAAMAALSRPHVSLLMTEFRRRGLVSYRRGGPLRIRADKLRRMMDTAEPSRAAIPP
jgi:CRP-like cAMP-binding protein